MKLRVPPRLQNSPAMFRDVCDAGRQVYTNSANSQSNDESSPSVDPHHEDGTTAKIARLASLLFAIVQFWKESVLHAAFEAMRKKLLPGAFARLSVPKPISSGYFAARASNS
jgi:hypothetical protein